MDVLDDEATRASIERALLRTLAQRKIYTYYRDTGDLRRELYGRHMAFFRAGKTHREKLFMAANRSGKTTCGAYEAATHLTGRYPDWWEGRVFDEPGDWLAAGTTLETTRDIVQLALFGPERSLGTGMIQARYLKEVRYRPNTNKAIDFAVIEHVRGHARLSLKSYDQGRKSFEGTAKQGIWLDEEPPLDIYTECLTRTGTTDGIVMVTFTPLNGATDVVLSFMEDADRL